MDSTMILDYAVKSVVLVLVLSLPPILVATFVGLIVSLIQALTQVQEQTLSFAVKLIAVTLTVLAISTWIGAEIFNFTTALFDEFPGWADNGSRADPGVLILYSLAAARILASVSLVPFLGAPVIPGMMRVALVFTWTILPFPMVAASAPQTSPDLLMLVALLCKEVVIGVMIGFLAAKLFVIAMSVGFFIDNQRGASMASIFDPLSDDQTSSFGQLIQQVVTVGFILSGGLLLFLGTIYESYKIWPVFGFWPKFPAQFPILVLQQADDMLKTIVVLAAPVVIAMFLAEFGLGLVNRFAPQLNVFFLAMPVKSILAVLVMAIYLPWLSIRFSEGFESAKEILPVLRTVLE